MARRRRPPGQRKQLRDARLMTLIGAAFLAVCLVLAFQDGPGPMSILGTVFGAAVLLVGAVQWWDIHAGPRATDDERSGKVFVLALMAASGLLGLASLGVFLLALTSWDRFSFATTTLFPRAAAVVAGAVGTVLFLGGPIALLIRRGRAFGEKPDDD